MAIQETAAMVAATAKPQRPDRTVFVGNIPYEMTEQQVITLCEEIGPVASFNLVLDKDSGKPKGYGFCAYLDDQTALSACRSLHGTRIGARQLRVNMSSKATTPHTQGRVVTQGGPGVSPVDAQRKEHYDRLLLFLSQTYSQQQLRTFIAEMTALAKKHKNQADYLFSLCPGIQNALYQAIPIATAQTSPSSVLPPCSLPPWAIAPQISTLISVQSITAPQTTDGIDVSHVIEGSDATSTTATPTSGSDEHFSTEQPPSTGAGVSPNITDPTHHPSKRTKLQDGWIASKNTIATVVSSEQQVLPFSSDMLSYLLHKVSRGVAVAEIH